MGMKKKDARSLSIQIQEANRIKAVKAVLNGHSQVDVAVIFDVTRQAVGKWMSKYGKNGLKGLKATKKGPKRKKSITAEQIRYIRRKIIDKQPNQMKLPFILWTTEAVGDLIDKKYGIKLSPSTVGRYLREWGFSPQKPIYKAIEQDPKAVKRWLDEKYPAIVIQAKHEGATIFWGDEMGIRSDDHRGRSYGLIGHTPVVKASGKRFGCNMISAISNRKKLFFMIFTRKFNALMFIAFLRRLIKQHKGKIFLIVDNHRVHESKKVVQWVERYQDRIKLFYLPTYSPELNPDELLNQDVKANAVNRSNTFTDHDLTKSIRKYLHGRQKQPDTIHNYFRESTSVMLWIKHMQTILWQE